KDDPQVIEIWNIVFMQYERKADGHLEPLGMNVIDTGMGFERLVRAIQGKQSNYDTDVFQPIIKAIGDLSGFRYGEKEDIDVAMRVVADHLRTIAFSIADGQLPGNAKAGYVIRRILRRAVRYAYTFLGQKQAFIYRLLPVLIQEMGATYPELEGQKELITKVMKEEEESFLRTLETGIKLLDGVMKEAKAAGKTEIAGEKAFTLFDTYGFPLDLTELICRENGLTVDEAGFNVEMQKQKERARNAAQVEAGDWVVINDQLEQQFVGYDYTEYTCHIVKYREVKQKKGVVYEAIFDQTPFYGEMGGEVGDSGVICNEQETIKVIDTKKENGVSVHLLERIPSNPEAEFMACVDVERRRAIEANHTCTHLLDQALKEVLGDHVEQKGSLVTPDYLRFDFSHFEKVTPEQLREVEHLVNERIRQNLPLQEYRDTPIEEAKKLGAIALFGEKYGDKVRVIQFGTSVEFCGGCHASSTGCIGMVRIMSESSVAAGVRRIEAITGKAVEEQMDKLQDMITGLRGLFNNAPDLVGTIQKAISDNADLKKQVEDIMHERAAELKKEILSKQTEVNGFKVLKAITPLGPEFVKDIAFQLRAEVENSIVVIGSVAGGKPLLTAAASDSAVAAGVNVGKNIREAAQLMQGGGGGQPHFATAGGKNTEGIHAAVEKLIELLTA
ncbi:MAG: alanine--tRNA ligase, partial [Bacteroidaceae bacterium]|nr:alanine--tRNA ligase [Bacteroidaceae bacterium]